MSMSPTSKRITAGDGTLSAASRPDDRRAADRRDALRATRAAREQQRGEFERALRRAQGDHEDEHGAPPPPGLALPPVRAEVSKTEPVRPAVSKDRTEVSKPTPVRPEVSKDGAEVSKPLELAREPFDTSGRTGPRADMAPVHPACEPHVVSTAANPVARTRHNAPQLDDFTRLRDTAPSAEASRWRFELADATLPIQRLDLQRPPGGTLQLALTPRDGRHAAPAEAALSRLQQRLSERGSAVAELHPTPSDDPLHDT